MKSVMPYLVQHRQKLFLLLTILSGIITLYPSHNFQFFLAQGDHGRELYCYRKVLEGALPYRDFSWPFGPLLLYYYGLFYLVFGVCIQSVLLGQLFFILMITILIYLICSEFISPYLSWACALWYLAFRGAEFFHSYHHVGGIALILLTIYSLFRYIRTSRPSFAHIGFLSLFLLMLVRLNMGFANLIAFMLSLFVIDTAKKNSRPSQTRLSYIKIAFTAIIFVSIIYWLLTYSLPLYVLKQIFPYSKAHLGVADNFTFQDTITLFLKTILLNFQVNWQMKIFGTCLIVSSLQLIALIAFKKLPRALRNDIMLIFPILLIFLAFTLHEFLLSNTFFRIYWTFPIILILIFHLMHYFMETGGKTIFTSVIKVLVITTLLTPALFQIRDLKQYVNSFKTPAHLLHIGNNQVYTTQPPDWFQAVTETTHYVNLNTDPSEKILALPHTSLYYFLTNRDSATRQLDFFLHNDIPQEQELETISDMEMNHVNWVIFDNRTHSLEPGMGTFGITHCPKIADYLSKNFDEVAVFGDWNNPAGWAWNHGTRVLKRKQKTSPLSGSGVL